MNILDQSPITHGSDAATALKQTVELAKIVDRLSFKRFWVSEHHNSTSLAGSAPEILVSTLAANTQRIRIGSGGVMLPHYSAYKVAESFRVLEGLYGGRIDLGIGHGFGGSPLSTNALRESKVVPSYAEQIDDLQVYLTDSVPASHRFPGLVASPSVRTVPEMWLLGLSVGSAELAAAKGISFTYGYAMTSTPTTDILALYRDSFKPSQIHRRPQYSLAISVVCADTEPEAEDLARAVELYMVWTVTGKRRFGLPTVSMAQDYQYSQAEFEARDRLRKGMIVGDPQSVKDQIQSLRDLYQVDEFVCLSNITHFEARVRNFELLSQIASEMGNYVESKSAVR